MGQKMLLNLPEKDLKKIETLVKTGEYTTKSEFIRFAVKQFLYSPEKVRTLEEMTLKLQKQPKARKEIEREIEEIKKETKRVISKMKR